MNSGQVQPKTEPAARSNILRDKETIRGDACQSRINASRRLTIEDDALIAVMIVEKIPKRLAAHVETEVAVASNCCRSFRQRFNERQNLISACSINGIGQSVHC